MSSASIKLLLPFIQANQAQKHVTHNESLQILDALTQISFVSRDHTHPPTDPEQGVCYLVADGAGGEWAGKEKQIAVYGENAWVFYAPHNGWTAWDQTQSQHLAYDGTSWVPTAQSLGVLDRLGVNASADSTNRLAVASDAILASHGETGDHQLKINKAETSNTGSLVFQTGYSGRAEMGLSGSDDFIIKTSADGQTFHTVLQANAATGEVSFPSGTTLTEGGGSSSASTNPDFGAPELITRDYVTARGSDLVTNGTGLLGNAYNFPQGFSFDGSISPDLPGSTLYQGYNSGARAITEMLPVNPNQVYRLGCYLRQENAAGDWSSFANDCRHYQYFGLEARDVDGNLIASRHHMRHREDGSDSLTTLAAPLTPGDTVIHLTDSAGWNTKSAAGYLRGVIIFGYRNSLGGTYDFYSRLVEADLFDLGSVDTNTHQITLNKPLPASLANPDDPNGTWPVGTRLANSSSGDNNKYSVFSRYIPERTDTWFEMVNHVGGIDRSGRNLLQNFTPGTAFVTMVIQANYSNRAGGWKEFPDSGSNHKVWFAGLSAMPEPMAALTPITSGWNEGGLDIVVPKANPQTASIDLIAAGLQVREI